MKLRTGFVSNSSSSSFMIYGVTLDQDEILEKAIGLKLRDGTVLDEENVHHDLYTTLEVLLHETGLEYATGPYDNHEVTIGRGPENIGDTETGLQFKKDVEDKLEKLLGRKTKCAWQSEAWYDG